MLAHTCILGLGKRLFKRSGHGGLNGRAPPSYSARFCKYPERTVCFQQKWALPGPRAAPDPQIPPPRMSQNSCPMIPDSLVEIDDSGVKIGVDAILYDTES